MNKRYSIHRVSPGSGRWLCTDGASGDAQGGEYVMFTYEGLGTGVQELS